MYPYTFFFSYSMYCFCLLTFKFKQHSLDVVEQVNFLQFHFFHCVYFFHLEKICYVDNAMQSVHLKLRHVHPLVKAQEGLLPLKCSYVWDFPLRNSTGQSLKDLPSSLCVGEFLQYAFNYTRCSYF